MVKLNRLIVSNAMFSANILAIVGSSLIAYYLTENASPYDQHIIEVGWEYNEFLNWSYVLIVGVLVFWYERPIRKALKEMHRNTTVPVHPKLERKAKQRLLNEPYFIIAIDFLIWVVTGLIFMAYLIRVGIDPFIACLEGIDTLLTAIITVTVAFFILQFVLQKWLSPIFFPEGQLSAVPGTQKGRIRKTLFSFSLALNFIPLSIIIFTHLNYQYKIPVTLSQNLIIQNLNHQIIVLSIIFLCVGVFLTLVVSRNISRPLSEMTKILKGVGSGSFDQKVPVTTNDEIGYTGDVINRMTEGLKERETLRQSLYLAQEAQQLLLPRCNPKITGIDIAGKSIYCDETGGDYFDFIQLGSSDSQEIGIVVGDVSGHGIGSALLMSSARAMLRMRSSQPGTLSQIMNDTNHALSSDVGNSGQFITLFYLVIKADTRHAKWVRAGHEPAIVYNSVNDTFEELLGSGIPLGIDADWCFAEENKQDLKEKQIILMATDGIWEARNIEGDMFGKEPIYELMRKNASKGSDEILECILTELTSFQNGCEPTDDVTLVVIKT